MAMRSRTTFKKRQKELARQEKQRDKAARRVQRKLEKGSPEAGDGFIGRRIWTWKTIWRKTATTFWNQFRHPLQTSRIREP